MGAPPGPPDIAGAAAPARGSGLFRQGAQLDPSRGGAVLGAQPPRGQLVPVGMLLPAPDASERAHAVQQRPGEQRPAQLQPLLRRSFTAGQPGPPQPYGEFAEEHPARPERAYRSPRSWSSQMSSCITGSSSAPVSATVSEKITASRAITRHHQNPGPASLSATWRSRACQIRSCSHSSACSHHAQTTTWARANTRPGSAPAADAVGRPSARPAAPRRPPGPPGGRGGGGGDRLRR